MLEELEQRGCDGESWSHSYRQAHYQKLWVSAARSSCWCLIGLKQFLRLINSRATEDGQAKAGDVVGDAGGAASVPEKKRPLRLPGLRQLRRRRPGDDEILKN